jgi:hypothetical protein
VSWTPPPGSPPPGEQLWPGAHPGYRVSPPLAGPFAYAPFAAAPAGPAPGLIFAGFWWRVLGYLLDGLITGIPIYIAFSLLILQPVANWFFNHLPQYPYGAQPPPFPLPSHLSTIVPLANVLIGLIVAAIVYAAYFGVLVSRWGRTVGHLAIGARVVQSEDANRKLPLVRALARAAVWWLWPPLFLIPLGVGGWVTFSVLEWAAGLLSLVVFVWVAPDARKQGLHDKLGRALVVRQAPGFAVLPYPPMPYPLMPYPYTQPPWPGPYPYQPPPGPGPGGP